MGGGFAARSCRVRRAWYGAAAPASRLLRTARSRGGLRPVLTPEPLRPLRAGCAGRPGGLPGRRATHDTPALQPEYKHTKVHNGDMEQQKNQPAPELPESQRNLTLTLIEAAAAYKAMDKVLDVVVPDAYEGVKHAAKTGMEKIRGSKTNPPSTQDSTD